MPRLTVIPLPPERVAEAYPLIRAATHVPSERWAAYVRLTRMRGGDVLVVIDEEGRIYGTAAFRTGSTLRHPRSLMVDAIAAFEFGDAGMVKRQLCEALRKEGQARGCSTMLVQASAPRSSSCDRMSAGWKELGLTMETMTVVQEIDVTEVSPANAAGRKS